MWIFTTDGFYSITKSHRKDGKLQVRSRDRDELAAFRKLVRKANRTLRRLAIKTDFLADYPFRIFVTQRELAKTMSYLARRIDYHNFKNAATKKRPYWFGLLSTIWATGYRWYAGKEEGDKIGLPLFTGDRKEDQCKQD